MTFWCIILTGFIYIYIYIFTNIVPEHTNKYVTCFSIPWYNMTNSPYQYIYRCPLNNTGFDCAVPLISGIFFNSNYYSTTWSEVSWICGCGITDTEEQWIWRADYRKHTKFWLSRGLAPLTHAVLRGKLYMAPFTTS